MGPQEPYFGVLSDRQYGYNLVKCQLFVDFAKCFHGIHMKVSLEVCRLWDPKGHIFVVLSDPQ